MDKKKKWTEQEIGKIYYLPLMELVYKAATVHRAQGNWQEVQVCSLLSIKTGGCKEDCAYCPQAARYHTGVNPEPLMDLEDVLQKAQTAKDMGATRFCMGAAWREVRNNRHFDCILEMVTEVNKMGMEVCCTLGMLEEQQALRLKEAGCYAYNHNIDTSPSYYGNIISTRQFDDRLQTLKHVAQAGMSVCCGGIIGLGETDEDRIAMLTTLANMDPQPESVPVNALVAVQGTPLQDRCRVGFDEMLRMIAAARILMPDSMVRLSAGRLEMSVAEQALCFMAGCNSIFAGEKLLTTPNPCIDQDMEMFRKLGLRPRKAFAAEERVPKAAKEEAAA